MDPPGGTKFRRKDTPHIQKLSDEGGYKLGGLSRWVFSSDQARLQPQYIPPMTNDEGFTGTYLAQGNSEDWLDQLPVHCLIHGHMLHVGQGDTSAHIWEEEPPAATLAKPFVIPIIKSSFILLDRVTKEEVGHP